MPPKVKITTKMILDASFEVIRNGGHENLNARTIAEYLKCSTQPVLYNFKTVDEIREAVYQIVDEYHTAYIRPKDSDENPLLAMGLNYVRFGYEEKNLFRFLFQTNKFGGMSVATLVDHPALSDILLVMAKRLECDVDEVKEVFPTFFVIAHGLASLLANNAMEYDEGQSTRMLNNVFLGLLSSRKG